MDNIISILKTLGLTGNEARIYLSLLKQNPATGYEISRMASVPRSAIYAVLHKLEHLNLVNSVGERPRRFIPITPEALVDHYAHKLEQDLGELRAGLSALTPAGQNQDVWYLRGYDNMILKARELLNKAETKFYISLWETEFNTLKSEITAAIKRGVEATIFSFTKIPEINAHLVTYDLDEGALRQAWQPTIILVTDHRSAIMGGARQTPENQVVWTDHSSIMSIATNHIILDITLAGVRLNRDVNQIVAPMMNSLQLDLDALIEESHPHIHFAKYSIAGDPEVE
ncbi:MAG: TrmB family transcriptional regulator [Candidatus Marinimicrobia bacterium]|nr:TrmB family transcriptional regulator [Candidatus Neomarinimicrobiota bacterium]